MKSDVGENYARCTLCQCDLNIAGGGRADLIRHINKPKHEKNAQAKQSTHTVTAMFNRKSLTETRDMKVNFHSTSVIPQIV